MDTLGVGQADAGAGRSAEGLCARAAQLGCPKAREWKGLCPLCEEGGIFKNRTRQSATDQASRQIAQLGRICTLHMCPQGH